MKTTRFHRVLSMLLVLCMVWSFLPTFVLPQASAAETSTAASSKTIYVVAGSDFQHKTGASNVTNILTTIKNAGYTNLDGFLFAGDYSNGYNLEYFLNNAPAGSDLGTSFPLLKSTVDEVYPGLANKPTAVYVQGNHDATEAVTKGYLSPSGANDSDYYGVYVIHEDEFGHNASTDEADAVTVANQLNGYLNRKIAEKYTKPIFVVSHVPLHFTMRTVATQDSAYSKYIFDVLNSAAAKGLNIIFMYGHNHSGSWEDSHGGTAVFYEKGDQINIPQYGQTSCKAETLNFTYMNAGYVGYYTAVNSGVDSTMNMSVFAITDDTVTITRYDANGVHNLKSAGVPNTGYTAATESDYFQPNTTVVAGSKTITLNKTITVSGSMGVEVQGDGITEVNVKPCASEIPVGYSYFQSYDIEAVGHTDGTPATVYIPVDGSIDETKAVYVIDHEERKFIPARMEYGNVVFDTDHFSHFSVAQMAVEDTTSTLTDANFKWFRTVLTGEGVTQDVPYVITESTVANGTATWMLTGTAATSTNGTGLQVNEYADVNTSHVWYFDGTYMRYGSPTGKYANLTGSPRGVTLSDTVDTAASMIPVQLSNTRRHNFQRADGTSVYLNRYGGGSNNVALTYAQGSSSRWYVHEVLTGTATLHVSTSSYWANLGGSIQMTPWATVVTTSGSDRAEEGFTSSNVTAKWRSLDTSIATVDENGLVTPVAAGQAYIRCQLESIDGYPLNSIVYVDLKITIVDFNYAATYVSATTHFGNEKVSGSLKFDTASLQPGGPYIIMEYFNHYYLSGTAMPFGADGRLDNADMKGYDGLEMLPDVPLYGAWYLDSTGLKFGVNPDEAQYIAINGEKLFLGDGTTGKVLTIGNTPYGADNSWNIYSVISADGAVKVTHRVGPPYNLATKTGSGSGYFNFFNVLPDRWVELRLAPTSKIASVGGTNTLSPTVYVDGQEVKDYSVKWYSTDTSVCTVDANGVVTGVSAGDAHIIATLVSADGRKMNAPLYVEVVINVADVTHSNGYVKTEITFSDKVVATGELQEGVPYIISAYENSSMVMTNTMKPAALDERYIGPDLEHYGLVGNKYVWYVEKETVDGVEKMYIRFGNTTDPNNYLVVDSVDKRIVRLGSKDEACFDVWTDYGNGIWRPYCSEYTRYLNLHGGSAYDTAVATTSYGENYGSRWIFNVARDDTNLAMRYPELYELQVNKSEKMTPRVIFADTDVSSDNYVITYSVADPSIVAVKEHTLVPHKAGETTVTATLVSVKGNTAYSGLSVTFTVNVMGVESTSIDYKEGQLALNSPSNAQVNGVDGKAAPKLTINYVDGSVEVVPLALHHLRKADGTQIVANEAATYNNVSVYYKGILVCTDFSLEVYEVSMDDYPAYPNEGSVMLDKQAYGVNFEQSGLTQIELSVSGIPARKGVDVIVMLDLSSSMNGTVAGAEDTRVNVLCHSLNNLISELQDRATEMDIRLAVGDFNGGYLDPSSPYYISPDDVVYGSSRRAYATTNYIFTDYDADLPNYDEIVNAPDYVPGFMKVEDMAKNPFTTAHNYTGETSGKYTLRYHSGTNYDYGLDTVYTLGEAAAAVDAKNGEYREVFVIFMSDGAPYQYNYFSSYSTQPLWVKWLNGTFEDEDFGPYANKSYYNPEGKHWMAEAIKGDRDKTYPVIRKNDDRDTDNDTWIEVPGLGATFYSVGFCLKDDGNVLVDTQQKVLENLATPYQVDPNDPNDKNPYVWSAITADQLNDAFIGISRDISNAVTDAYFVDPMGDGFHLKMGDHTYTVEENGVQVEKVFTGNKIQIKVYDIYTLEEYEAARKDDDPSNDFSASLIGTRKVVNGVEQYELLEEITFSPDGTQAYSSEINNGTTSILNNGIIRAKYFWYNAKTSGNYVIDTNNDGRTDTVVLPESFYWKVNDISTKELTLSYYEYLDESAEPGFFQTNDTTILYYTNYLGNKCKMEVASPILAWRDAYVSYGFYLVDNQGRPIASDGSVVNFAKAVKIDQVGHFQFQAGDANGITVSQNEVTTLSDIFRFYDENAKYKVVLNMDGTGKFTIYASSGKAGTTFVTSTGDNGRDPITGGKVNGESFTTVDHQSANSTVWFAVQLDMSILEDTVVIDYGIPVDIHPFKNDSYTGINNSQQLVSIGTKTDDFFTPGAKDDQVGVGESMQMGHGKVEILVDEDGAATDTIRYTPQSMSFATKETFSYAIYVGCYSNANGAPNGYYYANVNVIPATTIYFEDSLEDENGDFVISYSCYNVVNGKDVLTTSRTWKNSSTVRADAVQAEDIPGIANSIYGTDSAYAYEDDVDSLNCAYYTDVKAGQSAKVNFTFTGTGFDVVSRVNVRCGGFIVTVTNRATGESTSQYLDTFTDFVYNRTDKVWESDPTNTAYSYFQTPVIKMDMGSYSTYDVEIYIAYNEFLNTNQKNYVRFYMDGVRVYNPAGFDTITDSAIKDAYKADNEYLPTYEEVRDLLLDPDGNGQFDEGTTINGVFFISGQDILEGNTAVNAERYYYEGPNNEVYLRYNQSITFDLDVDDNVDRIYLGLKSTNYYAAGRIIGLATDTEAQISKTYLMNHNTEFYFDITEYNHRTVTITNTYNTEASLLAITSIKTTHKDAGKQMRSAISTNYASLNRALNYLNGVSEIAKPTVTLDHPTIAFEDEIFYNVYFKVSDVANVTEMGLITFDSRLTGGTIEDAVSVVPGAVDVNGLYMANTNGIPAKNMGDTVYFKAYVKLSDGSYVYSDVAGYNAVAYANSVLAGSNEAAKTLVVAMLNYGAAAQVQFGYNTDKLMNAGLTAEQKALVSDYSEGMVNDLLTVDEVKGAAFAKNGGFSSLYPKVSFEGSFAINYYAAPANAVDGNLTLYYWNQAAVEGAEVLSADNATGTIAMTADNGLYTAAISEIAAKQIDETFVVVIAYESNGQTYFSGPISYSLGAYCEGLANNADPAVSGLAQATATYGYYAKTFFAN